jgi:Alginate export
VRIACNRRSIAWLLAALALSGRAATASADAPGPALQLQWDARLRSERVADDAFARDASAETLRLRLGLHADIGGGWSALLEGAGIASAGDSYNSGANGHTTYPAITDPRGSQLNQAWLRWSSGWFDATVGRQRIVLDNHRWIGNVGWRQFEQTYDAVATEWRPAAGWTVRYDWLDRVHRVFGPDAINPLARARSLDTHVLNVTRTAGAQQWTGYAYLHDDRDVASASSATAGVRWTGKPQGDGGLGWTLEAARQSDYADNPAHFTLAYWLLEPAWSLRGVTLKPGWEHLAGNGRVALQTPLATLHPFNGWADQFLSTPPGGLDDRYLAVNGTFGRTGLGAKLGWIVTWHDFHADRGGRYGSEWDASLGFPVAGGVHALLKLADYRADGFGHDDTKLWLQFEWSGQRAL